MKTENFSTDSVEFLTHTKNQFPTVGTFEDTSEVLHWLKFDPENGEWSVIDGELILDNPVDSDYLIEFSPLISFNGDLDLRGKTRWVGAVQRAIAGISSQKSGSVGYTFQISKAEKYTANKWNAFDLFPESIFAYKESDAINKRGLIIYAG